MARPPARRRAPRATHRRGVGMLLVIVLVVMAVFTFLLMANWLGGVVAGGRKVMNEVVVLDLAADSALTEVANAIAAQINLFASGAGSGAGDPQWAIDIQKKLVGGHDPAAGITIPADQTKTLLDLIDPKRFISDHSLLVAVTVKHSAFAGPPNTQSSYGTIELAVDVHRSFLKFTPGATLDKVVKRLYQYKQVVVQPPGVLGSYTLVVKDWGYGRRRFDTYTQHFAAFKSMMEEMACRVAASVKAKATFINAGYTFANRVYNAATTQYNISWSAPQQPSPLIPWKDPGGAPQCTTPNDSPPLCAQLDQQSQQFAINGNPQPNLNWEFLHHMVAVKPYLPAYDVMQGTASGSQPPDFGTNAIYAQDQSGNIQLVDPSMTAPVKYLNATGPAPIPLALDADVDSIDDLQLYHRPPPMLPGSNGSGTTATTPAPGPAPAAPASGGPSCSGSSASKSDADLGKAISTYVDRAKQRAQEGTLKGETDADDIARFKQGDIPRVYIPTHPSPCPGVCDWFFSAAPDGFSQANKDTTGQFYDQSVANDFKAWKEWHDETIKNAKKYYETMVKNKDVKGVKTGIAKASGQAQQIKDSFDHAPDTTFLGMVATYKGQAATTLLKPDGSGEVQLNGLYDLASTGGTPPPAGTPPPQPAAAASATPLAFTYSGQGVIVAPSLDIGATKRGTKIAGNLLLLANGSGELTLESGAADAAIVSFSGYVKSSSNLAINGMLAVKDTPAGTQAAPAAGDADDQTKASNYESALPKFTVKKDASGRFNPSNAYRYSHITISPFPVAAGGQIAQ